TVTDGCGSSILTATGSNLLWSTGETTASITVTAAGTYTVTQTVGGCTSAPGTGNANPTAIPSAPVVTVTDGCGSSTLTATGTNLLWSTGETTASINVTAAGPYTVTQTVGGCTSAPGTGNANPTAIPSVPVVTVTDGCGSSTLTATGTNLLWSTGETTASITVTAAGAYTVTQTVGGCTSAPATGNANPTAIPSSPVVTVTDGCGSSTLTATGTNLLWSTGETTASITVTAAGPYTVTQTVGGCTSAPATGNANPTAIPSAPVVTVTDGCGSSTLTATGSNLLWSTGETTASITVTAVGPYTVTQTVGGCTSAPATGNANPTATPSTPVVTVTDGCGSSTLTATGTNLLWSTGETTASITVASAGTYTVTQTVGVCTSLAGSGIAAPQSIPAAPVVTVNNYCGYSDLTATGTNLLWSTGETTATINVTSGGTYYVSQSAGSCVSPTTSVTAVPLLVPAAPAITASGTTTFCEGDSVELSVSQTTGVLWSTGETTSAVMIYSSGNYAVTYTAANGCESPSSSMTVVVNPLPVVTLGAFADVCAGSDPFTLTGGNPSGGVFSGPGVSGGVLDPAVAGAGIHTITYTYTDGNTCSNSAQSTINISDCAGITELELNGISIYPNPATDQITLKSNKYMVELVKLYDAAGRLVRELQPSQMSFDVDITELEPAMYHVVITIENGQSFRSKIMKQ
ncbi:MAG: T9SS type A sorting domain-containing protein, partial [Bacteroidetes bacterium]